MKKFAMFLVVLSIGLFTIGCTEKKDDAPVGPLPGESGAATPGGEEAGSGEKAAAPEEKAPEKKEETK